MIWLLYSGLILLSLGCFLPLTFYRNYKGAIYFSSALTGVGSSLILAYSIYLIPSLLSGHAFYFRVPLLKFLSFRIDSLSDIFSILLSFLGISVSIYTPRYMEIYREEGRGAWFGILLPSFLLSMYLVVFSWNLLSFVFFWEAMTLTSYFLILWETESEETKKAAWDYFVTMHLLSSLPLFFSLAYVLCSGLPLDFSRLKFPSPLFYFIFLVAFGSKAGIFPMHFWLPEAHPAAPSNVSALLSGAMIKVAVYSLLRFTCFLMPINGTFGVVVAALGAITLTFGTLYALKQTDAKRLLAYHSVGQMGYIWLGIGIGIYLISLGGKMAPLGIVAIGAGLFHALNHAAFKGSLFLSSGAMIYSAGTKDLNELGGLWRKMPAIGVFTAIAALSIAGVPPLNGFVSKWLIYQVSFGSGNGLFSFFGILALFISAATLASFLKFYSSSFGGEPKSKLKEVPKTMGIAQGILSSICLFLGIFPWLVLPLLLTPGKILSGTTPALSSSWWLISVSSLKGTYFSPLLFSGILGGIFLVSYVVVSPKGVKASPWTCGEPLKGSEYKLSAKNYYHNFERSFEWLYSTGEKAVKWSKRASKVISIVCKGLCSAFKLSYRISSWARRMGERIYNSSFEFYLDEAIFSPMFGAFKLLSKAIGEEVKLNPWLISAIIFLGILVALLLGGVIK